jgi:uncharacterized membrane protein YdjX (TVP38/TMEM64 family)
MNATANEPHPRRARTTVRLTLLLAAVVALAVAARWFNVQGTLQQTLSWVGGLGFWAPLGFILLYVAATVLMIPAWVFTLGAGALFGVVRGCVYVSIAATAGASAAFVLGRYFARDWVAKRIAATPKFRALDDAVASEGWKIVGLVRLSPLIPFNVSNYAFGLTRVSFRDYFFASWVGMLPATVLYVYVGSFARAAGDRTRTPAEWALSAVGLVATIVVTVLITRAARRALNKHLAEPPSA